MSRIHVLTLGRLVVCHDDRELTRLPAQRLRCALLVHLAVERRTTRERILSLLERMPQQRAYLGQDWLFEPVWNDPDFQALVEGGASDPAGDSTAPR